jgi:cell division protein FtsW
MMTDWAEGVSVAPRGEPILPRWWRSVDRTSLACVVALFVLGLMLGLAASPPLAQRNGLPPFHYVERQLFFGGVAFLVMMAVSMMGPRGVRRLAALGFVAALAAVAALPLAGTDFGKGAVRWYSLGFGSVQPSEFLKPAFVVASAWLMAAAAERDGPPGRTISFMVAIVIVALLALQPDFGQAAVILFAWGVMWFVSGAPVLLLLAMAGGVVAFGVVAYNASEHFARRIDGYLASEVDPTTQLGRAAGAIREGGLLGAGPGEGRVKWSLPDAHTDFVIAVAAEEHGLVMVLVIIALFATVVIRSLLRLTRERCAFARLAGTGLACAFGVQAIVNMGVAVRLLPAKGMTLPFVSYGGSSLVAGGLALGALLALTRRRAQGEMGDLIGGRG